jgi:hypothetical protein
MDWKHSSSGRVPALKCKALTSNPNPTKKKLQMFTIVKVHIPYPKAISGF